MSPVSEDNTRSGWAALRMPGIANGVCLALKYLCSTPDSGQATYSNHMIFLTELHDWAVYYARAFSYTNRRFHPENAVWLPKGERYQEENVCLIYRHEGAAGTLEMLGRWGRELRSPLAVEAGQARK
jgi:hypothetical protein